MKHSVSDSVRDRVTAILGFTELLLDECYGSLYPRQEQVLKDVLQAASELRELLLENPPTFVED